MNSISSYIWFPFWSLILGLSIATISHLLEKFTIGSISLCMLGYQIRPRALVSLLDIFWCVKCSNFNIYPWPSSSIITRCPHYKKFCKHEISSRSMVGICMIYSFAATHIKHNPLFFLLFFTRFLRIFIIIVLVAE